MIYLSTIFCTIFSVILGAYVFTLYTRNVRFLVRAFGDALGQSRTKTVWRSYGNLAVILQSPEPPQGNRREPLRLPYGGTMMVR